MKIKILARSNLIYFSIALGLSISATASPFLCQNLFQLPEYQKRKDLINEDLIMKYQNEVSGKSASEVQNMNQQTLASIQSEIPIFQWHKKNSADLDLLQDVYNTILHHKVVSSAKVQKYNRPEINLGYCFGRATYVHLKLLSLGIQKESIQKIWAVGPMSTYMGKWSFHVATMAYNKDYGWIVIDSFSHHPQPLAKWMSAISKTSEDGKVRFYNTDASKFGLSLGKYSRFQMGLDLSKENDWYQNYFKDMMHELKKETRPRFFQQLEKSALWLKIKSFVNSGQPM